MALILSGSTGISTTSGTTPFADGAIGTAQLASDSVTTPKIAAGAVVTADIADNAVTTAKINNLAVTIAKLSATGTPSSSNFLRGDGAWETASSTPTTAQVLSATAGLTAGAVGTYAFLRCLETVDRSFGDTTSATFLAPGGLYFYSDLTYAIGGGGTVSGTWRVLGRQYVQGGSAQGFGLYLRIA